VLNENLQSFLTYIPYKMVFVGLISLFLYLTLLILIKILFPQKKLSYPLLLFGFSFLPIISVFREGVYESGDFTIHVTRTMSFYKNLAEGILIPRWAGELNATFGYALFEFVYPLPYYLASFYHFLGANFINSVKLLLISTYISSGLTMYFWLKNHVSSRNAFLGSIFYLFAPYHLVDMHFRSDIGEMTAFVFLPLSLFFIDKAIRNNSFLYKFLGGLSIALLVLSRPALSLLGFGIITSYPIFIRRGKKLVEVLQVYISHILGLLLSAYYWLPVFLESKYAQGAFVKINLEFYPFTSFFYSPWRYGFLFQGPHGELAFVVGYGHWLVLAASCYLIVSKKKRDNFFLFFFLVSLALIFLMQGISEQIWYAVSFLTKMMLTYRPLATLALTTSALAAYISSHLKSTKLYYLLIAITVGTTILNWGNRKNIPQIKDDQISREIPSISASGECFWPALYLSVKEPNCFSTLPDKHIEAITGDIHIIQEKRKTTLHTYLIDTKRQGLVKENTSYFPGWRLLINGKERQILFSDEKYPGIITFYLNEGRNQVELVFQETQVRKYSLVITLLALFISGFYLLLYKKRD